MKYAGADATAAYDEIHAPGILEKGLSKDNYIGHIDPDVPGPGPAQAPEQDVSKRKTQPQRPDLYSLISVHDFEDVARRFFTPKAFAFYSSAATDLVSHNANLSIHRKIMLRPRVLRNVKNANISRKILGHDCSAPFFVSPAAMARLAHPDGELAIAQGCASQGIIQTISSNASFPLSDIVSSGQPNPPFFLQLYVNSERQKTATLLHEAKHLGIKAIFVTVDAPIPGKREADERIAAVNLQSGISGAVATNDKKGGGLGRVMAKYIDSTLNWEDIAWLKKECDGMPIILKGIQTAADAIKALEYGVQGILLSNHGGRSLDTTQASLLTLLELHALCPQIFTQTPPFEIYLDGGFTCGTDILKALCLGATAIGIGRPYLYSLAYGCEGVKHLTEILKDELVSSLKLSGITDLNQVHPEMVNTAAIDGLVWRRREVDGHPWIRWKGPRGRRGPKL